MPRRRARPWPASAAEDADEEAEHADDDHADDERPDARLDAVQRLRRRSRCRPGWAGGGRGPRRRAIPTSTRRPRTRRTIRRARDAERHEDAGHRDGQERQDAVQDAPADRAEDPLPEEQRRSEDDAARAAAMTRTIAAPMSAATCAIWPPISAGLGLGQLDVGHDQPHRGVPEDLDLGAEPWGRRRVAAVAGRQAAAGRRRRRTGRRRPWRRSLGRGRAPRSPVGRAADRSARSAASGSSDRPGWELR